MTITANLGHPRIGRNRELKRAAEGYWAGRRSAEELLATARELRLRHWRLQRDAGVDHVPSNDFSLYDQVLDTAVLVGAVPTRYGWEGGEVGLDTYFAMARGSQTETLDVRAMEMTKWFDTNYHYIVPELGPGQSFRLSSEKPFRELAEAREAGITTRPVLLGPVSFLLLSKPVDGDFDPLERLLEPLTEVYARVLERLADSGAEWIQLDEPCFVQDRSADELHALERAYAVLAEAAGDTRLLLQTYFGHVGEAYPTLARLPVEGLGLDLVRGRQSHLDLLRDHGLPGDKLLFAGVVDGRNVWINDLEASLELLEEIGSEIGRERVAVCPSCSLLHVPFEVESEEGLDEELRSWLAFAAEKLREVAALGRALEEGPDAARDALERSRAALASRSASSRTRNPTVRERLERIRPEEARRSPGFHERRPLQGERLGLPLLPTTVIGSFPQHADVRAQRRRHRNDEVDTEIYEAFLEGEIERAIRVQEEAGIDAVVHGEFERNDMVEYFAEQLDGYAFTANGWVQSYGSRCVKPPVLFGDVSRPGPMTVRWWEYASSVTDRPVKGMLTGPVTMLQWSFVRDDQPRSATCLQLALAVRDEVADLEAAGAPIIQVDEPALREGLPLRRDEWDAYLSWAVGCFRVATTDVEPVTQIHTHMCYSEFNDIIAHIARMDADVLLIENARSDAELLEVFRRFEYDRDIGPGVYDIHSPRVPSAAEMADRLRASLAVLPAARVWVNPDCGLKTRRYEEVVPALNHMVQAARTVREEIESE